MLIQFGMASARGTRSAGC